MISKIALALLLCLATTELIAQERVPAGPDNASFASLRLRSAVTLERPTIIILAQLPEGYLTREQLRTLLAPSDSLQRELQVTAQRWGYSFAIRSTGYEGIRDRSANAYYAGTPLTRPALVIARPGSPPRLLRFWPRPDQLEAELRDYDRVFRPLLPA